MSTCVWDVLNFVIMVREIAQITTWNLCLYMVAGLIQIYTIRFKDQGEMIKTLLLNNVINVEIFQVDIVEVDTAKIYLVEIEIVQINPVQFKIAKVNE